jgi:hypothetical protein
MANHIAALVFRTETITDRALSQGFAVALAGFDAPAPRLLVGALPGIPFVSVAFYASGAKLRRGAEDEELEHARELFEEEPSPAVGVLDAASAAGHEGAVIYALVRGEGGLPDDGWRFDARGFARRCVREGDAGIEACTESPEEESVEEIEVDLDDGASEDEERRALEEAIRPHRGSTFLSAELKAPVLPAIMAALFADLRRVEVRLVDPAAATLAEEVLRLDHALRRSPGRGAFAPPEVAGVRPPEAYAAFARVYDWVDPTDPGDAYRELSIGRVSGTLCFLREADLSALTAEPGWARASARGVYPLARLSSSALGGSGAPKGVIGLAENGDDLVLVSPAGDMTTAGPTFGELIRYLALGWSKRSDAEEDMIEALMLRAKVRISRS